MHLNKILSSAVVVVTVTVTILAFALALAVLSCLRKTISQVNVRNNLLLCGLSHHSIYER